jgi:hypothetical protein
LPCSSNAIKATPLFLFLSLGGERDGPFLSAVNRLAAIDKLNCPIHLIILKPVFRPESAAAHDQMAESLGRCEGVMGNRRFGGTTNVTR